MNNRRNLDLDSLYSSGQARMTYIASYVAEYYDYEAGTDNTVQLIKHRGGCKYDMMLESDFLGFKTPGFFVKYHGNRIYILPLKYALDALRKK